MNGTSDEPAHYVTGLMVRDYVAAGFPGSPLAYARNYYLHYPKVGLGHWPPLFYVVQAAWTLVFTESRTSVMLLMACITALLATVLCDVLRREFSFFMGAGAALLLISLPIVEEFNQLLMAEMLVSLLVLLAVLSYGRYLATARWQPAAWFGLWFALALLTKGTAIQLALVPPFALLISRRWYLLRRFSFGLPAILVLGLAGPWYFGVPGAQHESVARFGGIRFRATRLTESFSAWSEMLGAVLVAAAVLGIVICGRRILRRDGQSASADGKWVAGLAVLLGAYLVRLFVGAYEARHLLVNLPILVMFAAAGVDWLFRRPAWRGLPSAPKAFAAGVVVMAMFTWNVHRSPIKRHYGYAEVARDLLSHPEFKDSVFLVSGGGKSEGVLISEVAAREIRPGHIVLRASKMLASDDWMGWRFRPLFQEQEEMLRYLESIPVGIVLIDENGRDLPDGQMLYQGIQAHPEKWELLGHYSPGGGTTPRVGDILVYRLIGHEGKPVGKIKIPMRSSGYGSFEN